MSRRIPLMLQVVTADPRPINRPIVDGVRRVIAERLNALRCEACMQFD